MGWRISEDKDDRKTRSSIEDIEAFVKLMEYLERKKEKKGAKEKATKKDTKHKWIRNPDFDDKARTFTFTETTSLLVLSAFPMAWAQIFIFQYFTNLLRSMP
jgi:hypothetical protein